MLLGYGAKVCLRKMRVKAENRMVTSSSIFDDILIVDIKKAVPDEILIKGQTILV